MTELLRVEHIVKSFPGVRAVDDVSFTLEKGEVLALLGENGAGKSTLMQVLGGVLRPDAGTIVLDNRQLTFMSAHDAIVAGISMVFQELSLVGGLSIAENIFADRQPVGALNNIHWGQLYSQTQAFLASFDMQLDARTLVKRLSMGQQQILEILKAISTNPKLLILDEPTSSLTTAETEYLFATIRRLRETGISFIYITHKLSEVFRIADRVLVLRDGRSVGSRSVSAVREADLVAMMVGRAIGDMYGEAQPLPQNVQMFFEVQNMVRRGASAKISFGVRRGEIVGFAGLVGAGRTELARCIFGLEPADSGEIFLDGEQIIIDGPQAAIQHRIAYLTEDRKGQGLFLDRSVSDNLIAATLRDFTNRLGFLRKRAITQKAQNAVDEFDIATSSLDNLVLNLSGGNQQKCMIATWMAIMPQVLIFDEPTRGVDVGARAAIYHKLREVAASGTAVILISSELPELIGMCDRILVLHQGHLAGEVMRPDFSEELILSYAAGLAHTRHAGQVLENNDE